MPQNFIYITRVRSVCVSGVKRQKRTMYVSVYTQQEMLVFNTPLQQQQQQQQKEDNDTYRSDRSVNASSS